MKIKINLLLIVLFISLHGIAQDLIAVQNGGIPNFYEDLHDAIENAVANDTIYLPGKSYDLTTVINKKIHFVGVGKDSDSTLATNITILNSTNQPQITLDTGSDGGSITGIYFTSISSSRGNIDIINDVNNYKISRCFLYKGITATTNQANYSNFLITQNVLGKTFLNENPNNILITNNVFLNVNNFFKNSSVKNNVFTSHGIVSNGVARFVNCLVENNIFDYRVGFGYKYNTIFRNNLNKGQNTISGDGSQGNGNIFDSIFLENVFVTFSGNGDVYTQIADFNLLPNSPYKNAGTDGTDLGIYGGAFPWKEIPFNPHIETQSVSPTTDGAGNLNINMTIKAQED